MKGVGGFSAASLSLLPLCYFWRTQGFGLGRRGVLLSLTDGDANIPGTRVHVQHIFQRLIVPRPSLSNCSFVFV